MKEVPMHAIIRWIRYGLSISIGVAILWSFVDGTAQADVGKSKKPAEQPGYDSPFVGIEREAHLGDEMSKSRAYVYAPPPMPHQVGKQEDCMQCHAPVDDIKKKWRSIRPMAHPHYSQCKQCHVPKTREGLDDFVESDFLGLGLPGKGSRAHDYAPPTVPHKIFMRNNCLSCHGPTGYSQYRTSHPERSQCLQCHAPEANMDYTRPQ